MYYSNKASDDMSGDIERILAASAAIPGWTAGDDAREVAMASYALPHDATIAEIGVFMGRCTVLLAGPRRIRGSGKVHCVDPFDCSGDTFSVPFYLNQLKATGNASLVEVFLSNVAECQLADWVELHKGRAQDVAAGWSQPLDLLLLDGDQSPHGARTAYESWIPFLKRGGIIILRNTRDRQYAEDHDGHRRLAVEELAAPRYSDIRQIGATTFATKQF
jgi:hypothetical protein